MRPRVFCLCLSPALDATVTLSEAPQGRDEVFSDVAEVVRPGGKGLNVARHLAAHGVEVVCGGLLGADNAAPFVRELAQCGVADAFVRVAGETRRNEMIVWPGGGMKLNRTAFPQLAASSVDIAEILRTADGCSVAVLSGSLPRACPPDFYARVIRPLRAQGVRVALDARGEALRLGLAARPDLVKPNAEECRAAVGFVPRTPEDFGRATAALRTTCGEVVISDGAAGAWFEGALTPSPKVQAVDTTGAGDALLAEYVYRRWLLGEGVAESARWAVAAGAEACTRTGG